MTITLIRPEKNLEGEFRAAISEFRESGEKNIAATFSRSGDNFDKYLQFINNAEKWKQLPKGFVPYTTFCLVENVEHILGFCHLRHHLNISLSNKGGHIGYAIRPSERCKGYGTKQLQLLLEECRKLKYDRVLITCDYDNVASQKIIKVNGGIQTGEVISSRSFKRVFQYWVSL